MSRSRRTTSGYSCNNFQASVDPEPGDLIEIFRGAYAHWAIYVGDGYVIHLTSDGPPDSASVIASSSSAGYGVVKKERLIDVAGWNRYKVNNESDAKWNPLPVKEILKNAEAQVGKRRNYSVTTANCEHFVNELRYGKSVSYQVHHFGVLGIPAVAAAAVVGGAAVVGAVAVCSPAAAGVAVVGLIGYGIRALRF
ncbi:phospholipase A and acyltransferase 3-like [Hemiscyllium ocellatum]|uniref:phospholipase A and acyltransferase 3-like n=1 Tax=Hemiscyllium ocellatum TaxID=170820 RepID=UPI0029670648|nr:phospholipase A and acyltransferase 3-like [Hemiscyllium ocellatum]